MLTDGQTDARTDDRQIVITIAHHEHSSGELKGQSVETNGASLVFSKRGYSWIISTYCFDNTLNHSSDASVINLFRYINNV